MSGVEKLQEGICLGGDVSVQCYNKLNANFVLCIDLISLYWATIYLNVDLVPVTTAGPGEPGHLKACRDASVTTATTQFNHRNLPQT